GVALHYLAFAGALALLLWLVVPRAADQVSQALGTVPTSRQQLKQQAKHSSGIKHELLVGAQKRLKKLPKAGSVVHGAVKVRVMGHVTGVSPLLVLVGVSAIGLLLGGVYVLLATPLLAVLVTLVDVIVRDKDPADEDVPAVLFAKESRG